MSTPFAVIVSTATDRRGVRSVRVSCPYCNRRHVHGWDPNATATRVSHCGQGDYRLVVTPGDYAIEEALA